MKKKKKYILTILFLIILLSIAYSIYAQTFTSNLKYGLRNSNDVRVLQQILINKGYLSGIPSGNFLNNTREAVKKFQKANGLKVDGAVGPLTRKMLFATSTNSTTLSSTTTKTGDTIAPTLSSEAPSGTLPSGTTSTSITLSTDENASCKYSTDFFKAYDAMENTFSTTGSTSHNTSVSGLHNGHSYFYYVKCKDNTGNINTKNLVIYFSIGGNIDDVGVTAIAPSYVLPPPSNPSVSTPPVTNTPPTNIPPATTPPANPPSTGGYTNEPFGMTKLAERGFNCGISLCEDGWLLSYGPLKVTIDNTAPKSPSNVGEILYGAGFTGGKSPSTAEKGFGVNSKKTMYVSTWIKLSSNWQSHPVGVNKVIHFFVANSNNVGGGSNKIFLEFASSGGQPNAQLKPGFGLQGIAAGNVPGASDTSTSPNIFQNIGWGFQILRGQWYNYEILLGANTPGVADGTVDMWVDGTKIMHYTNIMFIGAGSGNGVWSHFQWSPTWGGGGGVATQDFSMYMDHVYISGK